MNPNNVTHPAAIRRRGPDEGLAGIETVGSSGDQTRAEPPADPIAAAMNAAEAGVPRLLTPADVAEQLGLTERTLERWRITGEGPRFVKLSRSSVRYLADDITAFIADRLRANTAQ